MAGFPKGFMFLSIVAWLPVMLSNVIVTAISVITGRFKNIPILGWIVNAPFKGISFLFSKSKIIFLPMAIVFTVLFLIFLLRYILSKMRLAKDRKELANLRRVSAEQSRTQQEMVMNAQASQLASLDNTLTGGNGASRLRSF